MISKKEREHQSLLGIGMKKIILYSILSFESFLVWLVTYHAELTAIVTFGDNLESIRILIKNLSLILFLIFTFLLAYESLRKEDYRK